MANHLTATIKISSKPETLKTLLFKYGRVIVEMDKIENDYTRSCKYGDLLIVESGSPKVTKAKRYVVGINDKLIYCRSEYQLETFEILYSQTGISYKECQNVLGDSDKRCKFAVTKNRKKE